MAEARGVTLEQNAALQEEIARLTAVVDEKTQTLLASSEACNAKTGELAGAQAEVSRLEVRVSEVMQAAQAGAAEVEGARDAASGTIRSLEEQINSLRQDLEAAQERETQARADADASITQQAEAEETATAKVNVAEAAATAAETARDALSAQVETARGMANEAATEVGRLGDDLEKQKAGESRAREIQAELVRTAEERLAALQAEVRGIIDDSPSR